MLFTSRTFVQRLLLLMLPLAAFFIYSPGLSGPFLFDDWANLPALGKFGTIDNWDVFLRYITSGTADPTGRPIALLSFLLDANDWPADPWRFKLSNILLHGLNGLLLAAVLLQLNQILGKNKQQALWIAFLAAALWLLHPLWVSSTLYVVQRHAMLVATWFLLALLGYLLGRRLVGQQPIAGYLLIVFSIVIGTLLAVLSKGNGALLPAFIGLAEWLIIRRHIHANRTLKAALFPLLALPSLMVVGYLIWRIPASIHFAEQFRPFSLSERLLTEARVLWDYLGLLYLPRPYTTGVFNDAYVISHSLWQPWTTLPAILGIIGLIALVWKLRARQPVLAFSLAMFLTGHLLESTIIPLELYFEHRNYVPALFLFWPLAWWLVESTHLRATHKFALSILLIGLLSLFTWMRADLWGNPLEQVQVWARLNPDSPRAQTQAALYDMKQRNYSTAITRLETMLAKKPDSAQAALNLLSARCGQGAITHQDIERARYALAHNQVAKGILYGWMEKIINQQDSLNCPGLDQAAMTALLDAAQSNPAFQTPGGRQDILHLRGLLALEGGDGKQAADYFRLAVHADPNPDAILSQSALLGKQGFPELGLQLLEFGYPIWKRDQRSHLHMKYLHHLILQRQNYWENEFDYLKNILQEDIDAQTSR